MQTPMEYSASVPNDVATIIHQLTTACSNWPLVPIPNPPLAPKLDDTTILAMNICQTALGNVSGMEAFVFGILTGVILAIFGCVLWGTTRSLYRVIRRAFVEWKQAT